MDESQKNINELELPDSQTDAPSVYAFSLHKAGSTLLFNMLMELAPHVGYAYFSLPDQIFINGIIPTVELSETERLFKPTGYLYGGFRFYPTTYTLPNLNSYKKILLVRNPMDSLVSMYFSGKKSHLIPKKGRLRNILLKRREDVQSQDIEAFVRGRYQLHIQKMKRYKEILSQDNLMVYRYEDIIYDKLGFLKSICHFYEWDIGDGLLQDIVSRYDVFPETEHQDNHIRQVHPNNYKKQLSLELQHFVEEKFAPIMEDFGYKLSSKVANSALNNK